METPQDDALVILLELDPYAGPEDAFLRESTTVVRGKLNCDSNEAERLIKELQESGQISIEMTPGGQLQEGINIPLASFRWCIPRES